MILSGLPGATPPGIPASPALAHSPCDGMVGARGIAAHAQSANHLAVLIESDAAAEGDDSACNLVETGLPADQTDGLKGLELFSP